MNCDITWIDFFSQKPGCPIWSILASISKSYGIYIYILKCQFWYLWKWSWSFLVSSLARGKRGTWNILLIGLFMVTGRFSGGFRGSKKQCDLTKSLVATWPISQITQASEINHETDSSVYVSVTLPHLHPGVLKQTFTGWHVNDGGCVGWGAEISEDRRYRSPTYSDNMLALPSTGHAEPWPSGTAERGQW